MSARDEILQQSLALPEDDRRFLVEALENSIGWSHLATTGDIEAWVHELERRADAFDRGELAAVDRETSLSNIRQSIEKQREKKEAC